MRGQSGLAAYDRAKKLRAVFRDEGWRESLGALDDDKLMDALNHYVQDLCFSASKLLALLDYYGDRNQWATGKLADMWNKMREAQLAANRAEKDAQGKSPRKRCTVADLEESQQREKHWQATAEMHQQRAESMAEKVTRLETELAEARRQLAEAHGRIKELERIAKLEALAA